MINIKNEKIGFIESKVKIESSVEDLIIGEELNYEQFLENEYNYRKKMTRKYSNDNKNKIIVMINEELAPKYVLQDIAFEYGKKNKNPILLLIGAYLDVELNNIEKQRLREEGITLPKSKRVFRIYYINTKEPFNHHLYGKIDIDIDEKTKELKLNKEINFKFQTLLSHFDFFTDAIHIISTENDFGYTLDFIKKYETSTTDIKFLDEKEIKNFFNYCKPFEKMSVPKNILIFGSIFSLLIAFFLFSYLNSITDKIQQENLKEKRDKERQNKILDDQYKTENEKYQKMLTTLEENKIFIDKKDIK